MAITFHSEQTAFKIKNSRKVVQWLRAAAQKEGFSVGEIGVVFTTDDYLLNVNRQYLGHDYLTDIITFDYCDPSRPKILAGDLLISVATVEANARRFGVEADNELLRVIIHGVLHLCGYGDKSGAEKKVMREREELYLELWKVMMS